MATLSRFTDRKTTMHNDQTKKLTTHIRANKFKLKSLRIDDAKPVPRVTRRVDTAEKQTNRIRILHEHATSTASLSDLSSDLSSDSDFISSKIFLALSRGCEPQSMRKVTQCSSDIISKDEKTYLTHCSSGY